MGRVRPSPPAEENGNVAVVVMTIRLVVEIRRRIARFFEDAADFSDQDSDRDSDDSDLNFDIEGFKKISHFGLFLCSTLLGS
jgi:hypothetical protein